MGLSDYQSHPRGRGRLFNLSYLTIKRPRDFGGSIPPKSPESPQIADLAQRNAVEGGRGRFYGVCPFRNAAPRAFGGSTPPKAPWLRRSPPLFADQKAGKLPTSHCNQSRTPPTRANCPCYLAKKWGNYQCFPYHHSRKYRQSNSLYITDCYFYANLYALQFARRNQHSSLDLRQYRTINGCAFFVPLLVPFPSSCTNFA